VAGRVVQNLLEEGEHAAATTYSLSLRKRDVIALRLVQVIMPARHPYRIDYNSSAWSCACRAM
jgi:hypothetical protein